MKRKLFPIFLFTIFMASCERDIDNVQLPDFEQKLVVHSFISSYDSVSLVRVSSNRRIYGEILFEEPIGNLLVTISDGTKEVKLQKVSSGYVFTHREMHIEDGKTYNLRISSDRGLFAKASCTLPIRRDFHLEADTIWEYHEIPGFGTYLNIRANVYLTDYPGENNYFRFASRLIIYNSRHPFPSDLEPGSEKSEYLTDEGKDGERIFFNTLTVSPHADSDSAFLIFYLLQTDKAYYRYHHSLDNYSGGDDPFSEVSPVYSNIDGGLGIFASYLVDSLVFRLK